MKENLNEKFTNIIEREKERVGKADLETVGVINKLRHNELINKELPFAASLLAYTIIERTLKEYIIKNIDDPAIINLDNKKLKKLRENELFITDITLKDIQNIIKRMGGDERQINTDRNHLVHSNLFFLEDKNLSEKDRKKKNEEYYKTALSHLKYVIETFSDIKDKVSFIVRDDKERIELTH